MRMMRQGVDSGGRVKHYERNDQSFLARMMLMAMQR